MIARIWHGWTSPAHADPYETLLRDEIFEGILSRDIAGFDRIQLLRRDTGPEVEFVTIMWFAGLDAVLEFAGQDYETAVVPEKAQALLSRFDPRSQHYDLRAARSRVGEEVTPLEAGHFESWLDRYGQAWENRDPAAAARLFTEEALYYWTPFEDPQRGRPGIAAAWREATSGQAGIRFQFEILAVTGRRGLARWWCSFLRLRTQQQTRFEGIFQVDFDEQGLCQEFREWWHSEAVSERDEGHPTM